MVEVVLGAHCAQQERQEPRRRERLFSLDLGRRRHRLVEVGARERESLSRCDDIRGEIVRHASYIGASSVARYVFEPALTPS